MNDSDFRWHLRQLPREREPSRDLWPAIGAAISGHDSGGVPANHRAQDVLRRSHWLRWTSGIAVALLMAAIGLSIPHSRLPRLTHASNTREHRLVLKEAAAIRKQYKAQFAKFSGVQVPANIAPALIELDASADAILTALDAQPDEVFLLDQLRRTYARRLELTQRMAML
ncbi:MAG TPA: hypothetical protein VK660_04695 [Xanthomonadaceae bacterium]|jgi:hypothetical protein|nr:hypothetical protein [Xanthomonadaceae bacterium]